MKTVDQSLENVVKGSLISFLEGKKNLDWLMGTIRSTNIKGEELKRIVLLRENYGDKHRYNEVYNLCQEQGLFE